MTNLGILLEEQGNKKDAKVAYQQAIDSRHTDATLTAAVRLGRLLIEQGDMPSAKAVIKLGADLKEQTMSDEERLMRYVEEHSSY
jgi:hypothetical protein